MKSVWITVLIGAVILIIAYFIVKGKSEKESKSWWQDLGLGVDLGAWGFRIGW